MEKETINLQEEHILDNKVLTAEEQARLTPDQVLDILKKGNQEFREDRLTIRNNSERVRLAASHQYPKAAVVSCLDSRVPVEDVFHRGIGDIFVARVAGNIINQDILGSLEYSTKVSGAKLIVVLGHERCGAIKSAIDNVQLGNITYLLDKIKPAVNSVLESFQGDPTSYNPEFMDAVCKRNIEFAIKQIRENSPIIREMEELGELKIVGALYDMDTAKVDFFQ